MVFRGVVTLHAPQRLDGPMRPQDVLEALAKVRVQLVHDEADSACRGTGATELRARQAEIVHCQ